MAKIPLTIRHVYDFGDDRELVGDDLVRPESWDALRTRTSGPFGLPDVRSGFERAATANDDLVRRAAAIDAWLDGQDIQRVASYGAGAALIEYLLWQARHERSLVLTDFGPATVERIAQVFPEIQVRRHDLLHDGPLDVELHLFHRIDTEFDNDQWREVLESFAAERILVVATEVIDARRALWEVRTRRRNPRATSAGWIRNRAAFERLWARTHEATPLLMHDLHAWDLRPRGSG